MRSIVHVLLVICTLTPKQQLFLSLLCNSVTYDADELVTKNVCQLSSFFTCISTLKREEKKKEQF